MASSSLRLLLAVAVLSVVAAQQFCPLEAGQDRCKSRKNQYKCGAFLRDLRMGDGSVLPLAWLGALPDFLNKRTVSQQLLASFGIGQNLTPKSFRVPEAQCSDTLANARCFAIMAKASESPLDSCAQTILNERGDRTVGNILCEKAQLFAPGVPQKDIAVGFFHSACGGDWTATQLKNPAGTFDFNVREKLCCDIGPDGKSKFRRCDGSPFLQQCPTVLG